MELPAKYRKDLSNIMEGTALAVSNFDFVVGTVQHSVFGSELVSDWTSQDVLGNLHVQKPIDFGQDVFIPSDCLLHLVGSIWWVGSLQAAISSMALRGADMLSKVPEAERPDRAKEFAAAFFQQYKTACVEKHIGILATHLDEEKATLHPHFEKAITTLPPPPSMEGVNWPDYSVPADMPQALLPLLNKEVSAFFQLLPASGKLVFMRAVLAIVPNHLVKVRANMTRLFGSEMRLPRELDSELVTTHPQGGESNMARHLTRWVYLMTAATSMFTALDSACQELELVSNQVSTQHPLAEWPFSRRAYAKLVADQMLDFSEHFRHPFLPAWVYTHPGMCVAPHSGEHRKAEHSDASSSALKFLGDQLKINRSVYHFPKFSDSQRSWEDWFFRISGLQTMFVDAPANHIIAALMGTIQSDDRRVYGWHDKMLQMRYEHREPTLNEFITHVRRQVLRTNTTRRTAHLELSTLTETFQDIDDCLALSTKLRQLWAQLYPVETEEVEPISRLNAAKLIHRLLGYLRFKGSNKLEVVQAWKAYTTYDGSQMFMQFLDENRHTPLNTEQLTTQYVSSVCDHLESAHRIFTQTQDLASASKTVLVTAMPKRPPAGNKKRGRSASASGEGSNLPKSQPRKASSGGRGGSRPPQASAQTKQQPATTSAQALRSIAASDARLNVGSMRTQFGLPELPLEDALAAINSGACVVCADAGHAMNKCPHRIKGSDASKELARSLVTRWRAKMYPESAPSQPK